MTANWRGRILSSEKERCYEINTWRGMVTARENVIGYFEEWHHPDFPLAFSEIYDELGVLTDLLDGHEKTCWEKWNIRPA